MFDAASDLGAIAQGESGVTGMLSMNRSGGSFRSSSGRTALTSPNKSHGIPAASG